MQFVSKLPLKAVKQISTCGVSFAEFCRNSDPAPSCTIAGTSVKLEGREYSTGSFGWMIVGRPTVKVTLPNGSVLECSMDVKLYVKDSKTAYRTAEDSSVLNPVYLAKLAATHDSEPADETVG